MVTSLKQHILTCLAQGKEQVVNNLENRWPLLYQFPYGKADPCLPSAYTFSSEIFQFYLWKIYTLKE